MFKNSSAVSLSAPAIPGWIYSPVPEVEEALQYIRRKYPPLYPDGLERPLRLLDKLGNPHLKTPFIFHVAGTNGKGSTLAFLQAIFEAGGLSVHKFISPHLVRFEERIVLNGRMIGSSLLLELIEECDRAASGENVSFFEFFTALAFVAYARHPADALLLETGLGGLHDATNVVAPERLVALLTRISHDHNRILGATLPEIARHKAGIIKQGCPVVVAPQTSAEVLDVFGSRGEPLYQAGREWMVGGCHPGRARQRDGGSSQAATCQDPSHTLGMTFLYKSASNTFHLPLPRLPGKHQMDNAGTALAALEQSPYKFLLKQETLEQAMRQVDWPGRLQRLTTGYLASLLPAGWELWLDGAHNDSGAEILIGQIRDWGSALPLHLITAMKRTKDAGQFYQPLLPHAATVQAADVSWCDAPMIPAAALCDQLRQMGCAKAKITPNLESAIRALAFQFKSPQRILVTGSLYLVGHALKEQP